MKRFVLMWMICGGLLIGSEPARATDTAPARDASLPILAAGDGAALWVIVSTKDNEFRILHRHAATAEGVIHPIRTSPGKPVAAAAASGSLYLVYADNTLQRIRVITDPATGMQRDDIRQFARLPAGSNFVAIAATRQGPVVLVTTPTDAPAPDATHNATADTPNDDDTPTENDQAPQPAPANASPYTLLTSTSGGSWQTLSTPPGLHAARTPRMVITHPDAPRIHIIDHSPNAKILIVHQHQDDDTWQSTMYPQPVTPDHHVITPGNLLVLVDQTAPTNLNSYILRDGKVLPAGRLPLPESLTHQPAIVNWQHRPAVIATYQDTRLTLITRDLTRAADSDAITVEMSIDPLPAPPFNREMLMFALIVVVIVFVLATSRRDPRTSLVVLPKGLAPADLTRRSFAAAIDLAPCLFITMAVLNITDLGKLVGNWPSHSGDALAMIPGALVIGLFVAHTLITELVTGSSLGKRLLGLQVVTVHGQRPRPTQILIRNAIKCIEMIFWLLLVFMLINGTRQRLGDIAARTIVVTRINEDDKNTPSPSDKNDPPEEE